MATIAGMHQKFQALSLTEEAKDVLSENSQEVVHLLQTQLYNEGVDGDNNPNQGYSERTVASGYLQEKGNPRISKAGDPYDYNDTGAFYDGMYLRLEGGTMEIDSSDAKTSLFPAQIRRLDTESKNGLRKNILQPSLVQRVAQKTGCGIG